MQTQKKEEDNSIKNKNVTQLNQPTKGYTQQNRSEIMLKQYIFAFTVFNVSFYLLVLSCKKKKTTHLLPIIKRKSTTPAILE